MIKVIINLSIKMYGQIYMCSDCFFSIKDSKKYVQTKKFHSGNVDYIDYTQKKRIGVLNVSMVLTNFAVCLLCSLFMFTLPFCKDLAFCTAPRIYSLQMPI